jgi:hypothetical protein
LILTGNRHNAGDDLMNSNTDCNANLSRAPGESRDVHWNDYVQQCDLIEG